jgi:hypothetical protein
MITSLDLWQFVEELLPLLREIERIEAIASKNDGPGSSLNISKAKP